MDDIAYMFLSVGDDEDKSAEPEAPPPPPPPPAASQNVYASSSSRVLGYVSHPKLEMVGEVPDDQSAPPTPTSAAPPTPRKRRGFRDFLSKANIQDQLIDKLFQQVIPMDSSVAEDDTDLGYSDPSFGAPAVTGYGGIDAGGDAGLAAETTKKQRPGFSVAVMSTNFRRFNARIGVVFRFQKKVERLLAWRRASHTISFLGVYTFVCLDPYLLTLAPLAVLLLGVLVPGFIARHPGTSTTNAPTLVMPSEYYARGPPLAPPRTIKPVKELSRDFFRNMGDLQNSMEDFSVAHDKIVQTVVPVTNFSDEAFSSALFVVLCGAAALLSVAAHLLPWRLLFLVGGWLVVCSGHPTVARLILTLQKSLSDATVMSLGPAESSGTKKDAADDKSGGTATAVDAGGRADDASASAVAMLWDSWVANDIILDEAPETREVEIFELQRRSSEAAAEWEPWVFSPSPYDPLSQPRLNANASPASPVGAVGSSGLPAGARFFEDVLPPHGWEWSEKKWALDLWSRDWVEERIITGVEVETEGERWVYDIYNEHEQQQQQQHQLAAAGAANGGYGDSDYYADDTGLHPPTSSFRPQRRPLGPGWEEGEEGMGRRGEWRRRRWVRMVKRRKITAAA